MNHGFYACDPFRANNLFYPFLLVWTSCAVDSYKSADEFHTITYYEL